VWVKRIGYTTRGIAFCAALFVAISSIASAQTAAPAASAPQFCPISVSVREIKGHDDEAVFTLWADDTAGRATGSIAAYAGNLLFHVTFINVVAADDRDTGHPPTPIVVRFDAPTRIDSAYVTSLAGGDCPIHSPFVRAELANYPRNPHRPVSVYPSWTKVMQTVLSQAAALTPAPAGTPETVEAPACAKPYVAASAVRAVPPISPLGNSYSGVVAIDLAVSESGSVLGTRVDKSSRQKFVDEAAVTAAAESRFAPQIYRCQPISGTYLFFTKFFGSSQ
jgi:TonB family protein